MEFPQSDLYNQACYGLAWCYLKMENYQNAIAEFRRVSKLETGDLLKVNSLVKIGDCWLDLGQFQKAVDAFDVILKEYPRSSVADYAQYQLGQTFYKRGESKLSTRYVE